MENTATPTQQNQDKILGFLQAFHCTSPVFPNDFNAVIRINQEATIAEALKKLRDHHILSIPVVSKSSGKPLWQLTMFDILAYFVNNFTEDDFKSDFLHKFIHLVTDKYRELAIKPVAVIEETADYTLDPVFVVSDQQPLMDAVSLMLKKKCHRTLVVDDKGALNNVITQSRIVSLLAPLLENVPIAKKTLKELGYEKRVISVNAKAPAFTAFKTMIKEKVSGLAVTDDNGKLVGAISISDFKLCGYEARFFDLLGSSVEKYLEELISKPESNIRTKVLSWLQEQGKPPVVVRCVPSDSLELAVKFFNFYGVHRIFIVDNDMKPIGVVSLYDVLNALVTLPTSS